MQLLEAYLVAYVEWEELESKRGKARKKK